MFYHIAKILVKCYFLLAFRVKVIGQDNIPKDGPVILCANHTSYLDAMALGIFVKRKVHFLAKKEIFANPFFTMVLKNLGVVPVNRNQTEMATFKTVVDLLHKNCMFGIFAQGTRLSEIDVKSAKSGVSLFAIKGKAKVVPCNISSAYKFRSKLNICIGEPIDFSQKRDKRIKTEELQEMTEQIMTAILHLGHTAI